MKKSAKNPRGKKRVLAAVVDDDDETEIESEAELEPVNEHKPIPEPEPEHEPQRELVPELEPTREHQLESNIIAHNSNPPQPVQHEQIDKSDESDQPMVKSKPPCARIQPMEQRKVQVKREDEEGSSTYLSLRHIHVMNCIEGNQCIMPGCLAVRGLINHWNNCVKFGCSICGPFVSRYFNPQPQFSHPQPQFSHQQPVPGNSQIQGPIPFNAQTNFSRDNLDQPPNSGSQQPQISNLQSREFQPQSLPRMNVPITYIPQPSTSRGHPTQSHASRIPEMNGPSRAIPSPILSREHQDQLSNSGFQHESFNFQPRQFQQPGPGSNRNAPSFPQSQSLNSGSQQPQFFNQQPRDFPRMNVNPNSYSPQPSTSRGDAAQRPVSDIDRILIEIENSLHRSVQQEIQSFREVMNCLPRPNFSQGHQSPNSSFQHSFNFQPRQIPNPSPEMSGSFPHILEPIFSLGQASFSGLQPQFERRFSNIYSQQYAQQNCQTNVPVQNINQPSTSQSHVSAFKPFIQQAQQQSQLSTNPLFSGEQCSQTNVPSRNISQSSTSQAPASQPLIPGTISYVSSRTNRRPPSPVRKLVSVECTLSQVNESCLTILSEIANNPNNVYKHSLPTHTQWWIACSIHRHQQNLKKQRELKEQLPPQPSDGQSNNSQFHLPFIPLDMGSLKNPKTVQLLIELFTFMADCPNDPRIKPQVEKIIGGRDYLQNAYCRLRMIEGKLRPLKQQQQKQRNS